MNQLNILEAYDGDDNAIELARRGKTRGQSVGDGKIHVIDYKDP